MSLLDKYVKEISINTFYYDTHKDKLTIYDKLYPVKRLISFKTENSRPKLARLILKGLE